MISFWVMLSASVSFTIPIPSLLTAMTPCVNAKVSLSKFFIYKGHGEWCFHHSLASCTLLTALLTSSRGRTGQSIRSLCPILTGIIILVISRANNQRIQYCKHIIFHSFVVDYKSRRSRNVRSSNFLSKPNILLHS